MRYEIKYLEPETGVFLPADTVQLYEADSEIDALRMFVKERKTDMDVEDVSIVSEEPFLLRIKGWAEADDGSRFELREDVYEYIAERYDGKD